MSTFEKALFDALLPVFDHAWKSLENESAERAPQAASNAQDATAPELKKAA